jgi:ATP-dependent Zn protease
MATPSNKESAIPYPKRYDDDITLPAPDLELREIALTGAHLPPYTGD